MKGFKIMNLGILALALWLFFGAANALGWFSVSVKFMAYFALITAILLVINAIVPAIALPKFKKHPVQSQPAANDPQQ